MKSLIRSAIINLAALYVAVALIPGFVNTGGSRTLFVAVVVLALMNVLIRPIISLLLLPINLLTVGAFRWLINVVVLGLLTLAVKDLKVTAFTLPGFDYQGFIIPSLEISRLISLVISSVVVSLTNAFLIWLSHEE